MKKVLFGIMALSMTAFAVNPGVTDPTSGAEEASVPVEVRAEIIKAPVGLTITDEAGTVLDKLLIDHGRIVADNAGDDSVAFKIFKVKRFEQGNNTAVEIANKDGANLKVTIGDATGTKNKVATLALNGDTTNPASKLASTLTVTGGNKPVDGQEYDHVLGANDLEHIGRVTSTIARDQLYTTTNTGLTQGSHHNSRENTLTVVYTPGKEVTP